MIIIRKKETIEMLSLGIINKPYKFDHIDFFICMRFGFEVAFKPLTIYLRDVTFIALKCDDSM